MMNDSTSYARAARLILLHAKLHQHLSPNAQLQPRSTRSRAAFSPKRHSGWTLIELMIVLTIAGLLLGLGTPGMNQWLQQRTETLALRALYHLSVYARTSAIKAGNTVTLCPSDDHQHCGGSWNKTVIIFTDRNKNETVDNQDQLLRVANLPRNTPCLEWHASAKKTYMQFKSSGASNGTAGHLRFCEPGIDPNQSKLVIAFTGRSSLKPL